MPPLNVRLALSPSLSSTFLQHSDGTPPVKFHLVPVGTFQCLCLNGSQRPVTWFSPVHAVSRGEDPARRHDGASTQVLAAEVQADLPGELTRPRDVAPDDPGLELRS